MIWGNFIIFLGLASFGNAVEIEPEVIDAIRAAGEHEALAEILGIDVSFLRPDESAERSEGSIYNHASHLGDIMLTDEQARSTLQFDKYPSMKWPNRQIPYAISNEFSNEEKQRMDNWANNFNQRSRRLKLRPRTNQKDYVMIINGGGCWSYLGRIGGTQELSLQKNGCLSQSTFQHEFMHAAGFSHEQNRLDRDKYVGIWWDNIPRDWHSQYEKVNSEHYRDVGSYDYDSVMHYHYWAPGTRKDAFHLPEGIDKRRLAAGDGLSNKDVEKLNEVYRS